MFYIDSFKDNRVCSRISIYIINATIRYSRVGMTGNLFYNTDGRLKLATPDPRDLQNRMGTDQITLQLQYKNVKINPFLVINTFRS